MKLSIVMPCYNGIKYIRLAVDSVLKQKNSDWTLIISDDGSNDGTKLSSAKWLLKQRCGQMRIPDPHLFSER